MTALNCARCDKPAAWISSSSTSRDCWVTCYGCMADEARPRLGAFPAGWAFRLSVPVLVRMGQSDDWYLCPDISRPLKIEFACHHSYEWSDAVRSVESRYSDVRDTVIVSIESFRKIATFFGYPNI